MYTFFERGRCFLKTFTYKYYIIYININYKLISFDYFINNQNNFCDYIKNIHKKTCKNL